MITDTSILARPGRLDDIPAATALTNLVMQDELGTSNMTVQALTEQWAQAYFEPERDSFVICDDDGMLVAMAGMWSSEPYAYPFLWGMVHPEHRGRGYGSRLMAWAEERVQLNLTQAPEGSLVSIMVEAEMANKDAHPLFLENGYVHGLSFCRMKIDLDEVELKPSVLPNNVRIRTHVPGQDDNPLWVAWNAGFADIWGYTPTTFEKFRESLIDVAHFDPSLWMLAVADTPEGEKIVGASLSRAGSTEDPNEGYVMELTVIRDYRRQGIALALVNQTFQAFKARGTHRVSLWVDAASLTGANYLYEKAGMHVAREVRAYEKVIRDGKDLRVQTLD